jgi:CheY-like chemotaxis protein
MLALASGAAGFDVVLCDLHLPDTTTGDLLAKVRESVSGQTIVLAMSATAAASEQVKGFDGFVQKPFQTADLMMALAEARSGLAARAAGAESGSRLAGAGMPPLDEAIFARLASALPAAQLLELYRLTLEDVSQRVERMRAAVGARDGEGLRREAHAIKGGCGMVGAVELRELAAAAEGGSPECTPAPADFSRACLRLERMLNARLA